MHASVLDFGQRVLLPAMCAHQDVLEVGALDVNGSLRPHIMRHGPASYLGIDLVPGPGVDLVWDVTQLLSRFGPEWVDLLVSTEMLEHAADWKTAVTTMKRSLRPGGWLLLTTRSRGFAKHHEHPGDFWRFELDDMRRIFADLRLVVLEPDPGGSGGGPGVFLLAQRPSAFLPVDLRGIEVYSMAAE